MRGQSRVVWAAGGSVGCGPGGAPPPWPGKDTCGWSQCGWYLPEGQFGHCVHLGWSLSLGLQEVVSVAPVRWDIRRDSAPGLSPKHRVAEHFPFLPSSQAWRRGPDPSRGVWSAPTCGHTEGNPRPPESTHSWAGREGTSQVAAHGRVPLAKPVGRRPPGRVLQSTSNETCFPLGSRPALGLGSRAHSGPGLGTPAPPARGPAPRRAAAPRPTACCRALLFRRLPRPVTYISVVSTGN